MKPASFRYMAPRDEDELAGILGEHGADARLLAGGQSLVPMMNFRIVSPGILVDINNVKSLSFITGGADAIELGALTRHAVLEDSETIRADLPIVAEAIGYLAHRAVRNRGTMGGSLALAYPNAELPLLFVALGATLRLRSRAGERSLSIGEFITGPLDTVLSDDEYIHSARLPVPPRSAGTAFIEVSRRHGDFALAAAAAIVDLDDAGHVRTLRTAVSGGQGYPVLLDSIESALRGREPTSKLVEDATREAVEAIAVDGDTLFPEGYRRQLLTAMAQRAVETAASRSERRRVH